ncbi:MAG: hypothetical protein FD167_5826 [bacterium]|nr:MAG: hypothetical protein FD167_5826 [bacterium]
MQLQTSKITLDFLIEQGRKAVESYTKNPKRQYQNLFLIDNSLTGFSTNESKIEKLIENGRKVAKNYQENKIVHWCQQTPKPEL